MSDFMTLELTRKGVLHTAECTKCGQTNYSHEWASNDPNGDRDAMQSGEGRCVECGGLLDAETYTETKRTYAARYSASGYMDCTEWSFGTNKRLLAREVNSLYRN